MLKIAIDIMGGDNSPIEPIHGIKSYIEESSDKNIFFYIVGEGKKAFNLIKESIPREQYQIIETSQTIEMHDKPSEILKLKPNSSMLKCIDLVKEAEASAVISAGNTGALLLSSSIIIKKIPGIKKAILAPIIPNKFGNFILADVGANINLQPHHFIDMAKLCTAYCKSTGNTSPSIHLLNIGEEKNKGTTEIIETYNLLSENLKNFKGNVESRNLMDKKLDIVLCNGFTGNIVLKLVEGLSHFLFDVLEESCSDSKTKKNIKNLKSLFDFELSTLLLGINGIVLKCHGGSSRVSFKNAIIQAKQISESNLINKLNSQSS